MDFYQPAEDSYFLCEVIKKYLKKLKNLDRQKIMVLDMGTGSGIQSENCIKSKIPKHNILAVDINENALKQAKKLKIKTIKSDLFLKLKNEKFDLIIFNPPYLPENKYDKKADTTGGKNGDEVIIRFIKQLKIHLLNKGVCFLLTSSLTPEKKWIGKAKKQKLQVKKIAEKKFFFEKLFAWEIKK